MTLNHPKPGRAAVSAAAAAAAASAAAVDVEEAQLHAPVDQAVAAAAVAAAAVGDDAALVGLVRVKLVELLMFATTLQGLGFGVWGLGSRGWA